MDETEVEKALLKYRPAEPAADLVRRVTRSIDQPMTQSVWSWAIAAAALLAVTVALHGVGLAGASVNSGAALQDEVGEVAATLGAEPLDRAVAELIVQREHARAQEQR
jgi:anti-sigma factor RsiW